MAARAKDLAALITAENGKPTAEALAEVRYAASFLTWFAGEAVRVGGETIPATRADLLRRLGRFEEAVAEYERALALTQSESEQRFLAGRIAECKARSDG